MAPVQSISERLSELEAELMTTLKSELLGEARGKHSVYFTRKREFIADGKKYQDAAVAHLEHLEREVVSLRGKLGEPPSGATLAVVKEFSRRLADAVNPWKGGRAALAREILLRLEPNYALHRLRGGIK